MTARKLLWIDDAPEQVQDIADALTDDGFEVLLVPSPSEGASILAEQPEAFLAVIVDLLILGEGFLVPGEQGPELLDTGHGLLAGLALGRWIKRRWPELPVIGVSVKTDLHDPQVQWFKETGAGYFDKISLYISSRPLRLLLHRLAEERAAPMTDQPWLVAAASDPELVPVQRLLTRVFAEQPTTFLVPADLDAATLPAGRVRLAVALLPPANAGQDDHDYPSILLLAAALADWAGGKPGTILLLHRGDRPLPHPAVGLVPIDIRQGDDELEKHLRRERASHLSLS